MKTNLLIPLAAALLFTTLSSQLSTRAQGTLAPPGPPAPTMKTLDEVEPRIPVDSVHTPGDSASQYVISAPGSYYLTTNLVADGFRPYLIGIKTNNVRLDLRGFSLLGNSVASQGINVLNFQTTNVVICDGTVSGFTAYGIYGGDLVLGVFEHLHLTKNNYAGLFCGRYCRVFDCVAFDNGDSGIAVDSDCDVKNCAASENQAVGLHVYGSSNRIQDNRLAHNGIGLKVDSSGNLIILNGASDNITNQFSIAANNMAGPILFSANQITTNLNPFVNFAF